MAMSRERSLGNADRGSRAEGENCRRNAQLEELTRNQILQYVAEMSEEMSRMAGRLECATLADSLKSASTQARGLLPGTFRD